jgi:hypothetical protein
VTTATPDSSGYVDDCGIADLQPAYWSRMRETTVVHHGIFENPFAEEWIEAGPESLVRTAIIDDVILLCDFPADSVMVKYIDQQQWSTLSHITTVGFDEVEKFYTVRDDGFTFEVTPMLVHIRIFKAFLLYYRSKMCWGEGPTDDDVMRWIPIDFLEYYSSKAYHDDYAAAFHPIPLKPSQRAESFGSIRGTRNGIGTSCMACPMTTSELKQGKKNNERFRENTKEDIYPTQTDHTHLVSDDYDGEKELFSIKFSFCISFSKNT